MAEASNTVPDGFQVGSSDNEVEIPRTTLTDGRQVYPEHLNRITEGPRKGQQQDYVVLAEEERAKGFVRPVRRSYKHLKCGVITTMGQTLAETYARDPFFYSGTFCWGIIYLTPETV